MKCVLALTIIVLIAISSCVANDLIIGTSNNNRLIWQGKAESRAEPFKKAVKEVVYSDPAKQIIKGLIVRDVENTKATATVTMGGVGFSYVNFRLRSQRGSGLNYRIEIYV